MSITEKYQLRVTLFGAASLENHLGRMEENPSRQSQPWLLLKYLLVNRGREVRQEELTALWPESGGESAGRVRLSRLREALTPLGLDGKGGLVQYGAGAYRLNPRYALDVDEDRITAALDQLRTCPLKDPAGLGLCMEALTLFTGPFLEKTGQAPWVLPYRDYYQRAFCGLARETLRRSRQLEDGRAVPLLLQRAPVMAPEDTQLHQEIRRYLEETGREIDLLRYPFPLQPKGRAGKEKPHEIVKKIILEGDRVFFISAASDRRPLCYTRWEALPFTRVFQLEGLHGLLVAVARGIHQGTLRTRADSKLTRALRKPLHALTLERFQAMEEEEAAELLAALTEKVLQDPDYDPAVDLPKKNPC